MQSFGFRGKTPFAELDCCNSPYFFGLDELHLFGANLGSQIWNMTASTSKTPFALSSTAQKNISTAIIQSAAMLPATFEGRLVGMSLY